jgi:hypothetical protein
MCYGLWVKGYGSWVMGYGLHGGRSTGYGLRLRITRHALRITDYWLRDTGYGFRAPATQLAGLCPRCPSRKDPPGGSPGGTFGGFPGPRGASPGDPPWSRRDFSTNASLELCRCNHVACGPGFMVEVTCDQVRQRIHLFLGPHCIPPGVFLGGVSCGIPEVFLGIS